STDAASTLTVTGYNYPSGTLTQGSSFSIKGTVSSNYTIKSVTVGVYNASGSIVSAKTVTPNAKSYNIAYVNSYIKFNYAKAGTNYYKITATDEKITKTLLNRAYTVKAPVVDPASTLSLSNANTPGTLMYGESFSIKGTVTSNYTITNVTVSLYNEKNKVISTKSVNPNAKSYSLSNISKEIKFNKSSTGKNYYKVYATDSKGTKQLLNQPYTVKGVAYTIYYNATKWHFEIREQKNGAHLTYEEVTAPNSGWALLPPEQSIYHDNGVGKPELKFIHPDGREAVFDGDTLKPITEAEFIATYNYSPLYQVPESGATVVDYAKLAGSAIGHFFADMLPYYATGKSNTREQLENSKFWIFK
ncbi:MAG: hypothetical protein ACI4II_02775, partial [Acutalibacteraceae bacterium]